MNEKAKVILVMCIGLVISCVSILILFLSISNIGHAVDSIYTDEITINNKWYESNNYYFSDAHNNVYIIKGRITNFFEYGASELSTFQRYSKLNLGNKYLVRVMYDSSGIIECINEEYIGIESGKINYKNNSIVNSISRPYQDHKKINEYKSCGGYGVNCFMIWILAGAFFGIIFLIFIIVMTYISRDGNSNDK